MNHLNQDGLDLYDRLLKADLAEITSDVSDLSSQISNYISEKPLAFASGSITASGAVTTGTNRIRSDNNQYQKLPKIAKGDYFTVASPFEGKVYIYNNSTISATYFAEAATDWTSGTIIIPNSYAGKFALILIRNASDPTANISSYVSTMTQYVKYYTANNIPVAVDNLDRQLNGNWKNILNLTDLQVVLTGVTFTTSGGTITVNGTASAATNYNLFYSETELLSGLVKGEKYYVHYTSAQDCYFRIYFYRNGNLDSAAVNTLTDSEFVVPSDATGMIVRLYIAKNKVISSLVVKPEISDTKTNQELYAEQLDIEDKIVSWNRLIPLNQEIPYTAEEYHALWDDLVNAGICQRSEATYMTWDTGEDYPLYTYTINANATYLSPGQNTNYDKYNTDGTAPLYPRKKILVVSGIHGSERATPVILHEIIKKLFTEYPLVGWLAEFDWTIVPLANPWGFSHSFVKNGSIVYHGSSWYPTNEYVIESNSSSNQFDGGIRQNHDGYDINRDFSDASYTLDGKTYGFVTEEAQYLQSVYLGSAFDFSFDMHQHFNEDTSICGYAAPSRAITGTDAYPIYKAIENAGISADDAARLSCGFTEYAQTSYVWLGTRNCTFNNYAAGYAYDSKGNTSHATNPVPVSVVGESGVRCNYYSGVSTSYNNIANAFGMTYFWELLKKLLDVAS